LALLELDGKMFFADMWRFLTLVWAEFL
jgi:hypothetical protein